jgi:hypothetical protein
MNIRTPGDESDHSEEGYVMKNRAFCKVKQSAFLSLKFTYVSSSENHMQTNILTYKFSCVFLTPSIQISEKLVACFMVAGSCY